MSPVLRDETLQAKCENCGTMFKPKPNSRGRVCTRECWFEIVRRALPDSWRILHARMKAFQVTTGKQPLMRELMMFTMFSSTGSVTGALEGLKKRGFVETTLPVGHKRRYRAIGVLPKREI